MKRKREGKIESSKMTKASGAVDCVALTACCFCIAPAMQLLLVFLYYPSLFCPQLLQIPHQGRRCKSWFPLPLRPQEQTESLSAHCTLGNQSVYWASFQNIGEGYLQDVGASPLNRPHLEGFYPPGMRASPRLHRWDCLPQLPQIYYGPSLN